MLQQKLSSAASRNSYRNPRRQGNAWNSHLLNAKNRQHVSSHLKN